MGHFRLFKSSPLTYDFLCRTRGSGNMCGAFPGFPIAPLQGFQGFFSGILFVPPIFPNFFFSIVLLPNCTTLCGGKKGKNDNTQLNAAVPCCCRSVPPRGILGLVLQGCYAEWTYIDNIAYPGIMHPEMLLWQGLIY